MQNIIFKNYPHNRLAIFNVSYRLSKKDFSLSEIETALDLLFKCNNSFKSSYDFLTTCAELYGVKFETSISSTKNYYHANILAITVDESYIKTLKSLRVETITLLKKILDSGIKANTEIKELHEKHTCRVDKLIKEKIYPSYPVEENREFNANNVKNIIAFFKEQPEMVIYFGRVDNKIQNLINSLFKAKEYEQDEEYSNEIVSSEEKEFSLVSPCLSANNSKLFVLYEAKYNNDLKDILLTKLIGDILVNSSSSFLKSEIRQENRLIYGLDPYFSNFNNLWKIKTICNTIYLEASLKFIQDTINKCKEKLDDQKLNFYKNNFIRSLKIIDSKPLDAFALFDSFIQNNIVYSQEEALEILEKISAEDVKNKLATMQYVGSINVKGQGK